MAYETFTQLLEEHKEELALEVAQETLTTIPALQSYYDSKQFASLLIAPLENITKYLHSGDVTNYREFFSNYSQQLFTQGTSIERFEKVAEIFYTKIQNLLERKLSGTQNERLRASYTQRLKRLQTLATVTAISTRIQNKEF